MGQPPGNSASERAGRRARPAQVNNDLAAHHYQAIIESSEDAILSKDLRGVILSWNGGAQRLFGFTAEEAIGKPITIIIPRDRLDEEPAILAQDSTAASGSSTSRPSANARTEASSIFR